MAKIKYPVLNSVYLTTRSTDMTASESQGSSARAEHMSIIPDAAWDHAMEGGDEVIIQELFRVCDEVCADANEETTEDMDAECVNQNPDTRSSQDHPQGWLTSNRFNHPGYRRCRLLHQHQYDRSLFSS